MLLANEAPVMLAGKAEADEAVFFVLERDPAGSAQRSAIWLWRGPLWKQSPEEGLVQKFIGLTERKGIV